MNGREAYLRRTATIPAYLLTFVVSVIVIPLVLPVVFIVDLFWWRHFALTRAWAVWLAYFGCEAVAIVVASWLWLAQRRNPEKYLRSLFALERWWARTLFRVGVWTYGITIKIEGGDSAANGPFVLLVRHVSPADNLFPVVFVADRHRIFPRMVINRSLLRDPSMDIVANRLPNAFVRAGSKNSLQDIRKVAALARDLGPNDAVAIFPEGALFTPARRAESVMALRDGRDSELADKAEQLENVLLPHLGGTLALLNAADNVDVVFCAHAGLDDAATYRAILGGAAIGTSLRLRFWRVAAADIPHGREARSRWLLDEWSKLDQWVGEALEGTVT